MATSDTFRQSLSRNPANIQTSTANECSGDLEARKSANTKNLPKKFLHLANTRKFVYQQKQSAMEA